ncbi:AAA-like domain-containing protein [Vibrio anguillarum]|uniref:AAA-like domain-containing protein n=1 Tax=Vibrio anguillarum TaxID=55601 RepID=UPI0009801A87|nr:AAA-like domain-containing protein [Vibrio anguillarum]AQP35722.1 hypothetical protein AA909_04965 [Vibrio anguillarum]
MTRVLKKYTTIPDSLYVNRKADIQLKRIIEDMQRPGYVLVARQMGKTNLLFNAKRQLESKDRVFAYVDMSNVYKKERECYQNIIDCIVEPNEDILSDIEDDIDNIRSRSLPPHKEYMRSLRVILKKIPGNLVVILDEIDALKTSDYSDKIFAQIRSNYFSRTSFPEFEKLTYILSGVIEPIELIQDRNKSPFNIGDKIYLDDFTRDEYYTFLEKSKLNISDTIAEHIYSWVHGNPRLTFDICSEVESHLIENDNISIDDIDSIINYKYLTNYDLAPVDHIRELVKNNIDVINYLIDVHNGSNSPITVELHKKLYLYGVVSSNQDSSQFFKNKIIKESLNLDWLNSIKNEYSKKHQTLSHALGEFDLQNYDETINILESLLESGSSSKDKETILYFLGWSYNKIGNYVKAVDRLSYNFTQEPFASRATCILGISSILDEDVDFGTRKLRSLLNSNDEFSKHNAMLNLARVEDNQEKSLELYKQLLCSASNANEVEDQASNNKFCCASLFFQHNTYVERDEIQSAISALNHALEYCDEPESFMIKFSLAKISPEPKQICNEIIDDIVIKKLNFEQGINEFGIDFNQYNLGCFLNYAIDIVEHEYFLKLYNYTRSNLFSSDKHLLEFLYVSSTSGKFSEKILKFILDECTGIDNGMLLNIYSDLSVFYSNNIDLFLKYFKEFKKLDMDSEIFNEAKLFIYTKYIRHMYDNSNFEHIWHYLTYVERKITPYLNEEVLKLASSNIHFWKGVTFAKLGNYSSSYESFERCSNIIKECSFASSTFFKESDYKMISGMENKLKTNSILAYDYLKKPKFESPFKKYTNKQIVTVRYFSSGKEKTGRYKAFIKDINALNCEIIKD